MQTIKKILSSKAFLFFLLLAVIWVGLVSIKVYYKKYQLDQEIASLKKEIGRIDEQDEELTQLIKNFNNQSFLEKEAKEKLNLKKSDENVVMVPEAAISQELPVENAANPILGGGQPEEVIENNLIKWWKYLFGR